MINLSKIIEYDDTKEFLFSSDKNTIVILKYDDKIKYSVFRNFDISNCGECDVVDLLEVLNKYNNNLIDNKYIFETIKEYGH